MKLFVGFLILALALFISVVAAYFSIVGLAAIFPATAMAVIVMGCSLEAGKLAAAGWLHENWKNTRVNRLHKTYMTMAVIILMMITSLGIFGFLSKGHLEQQAPLAGVELQIAQKEQRLQQLQRSLTDLNTRQTQLDSAVNSMIGGDKATLALKARRGQNGERAEIRKNIETTNQEINAVSNELVPLKLQTSEIEAKIGPVKYIAPLFGLKDTEGAIVLIIVFLIAAFDPLAVMLMLSSNVTISEALEERRAHRTSLIYGYDDEYVPEEEPVEDEILEDIVEEPVEEVMEDLEEGQAEDEQPANILRELQTEQTARELEALKKEHESVKFQLEAEKNRSDKDKLADILEKNPALLQEFIGAVAEVGGNTETVSNNGWMDENFRPPSR